LSECSQRPSCEFIEDGNPGSLRLHGRMGQAQLAYLAEGKGGALVLGKFGFDPISVRRMPPEAGGLLRTSTRPALNLLLLLPRVYEHSR